MHDPHSKKSARELMGVFFRNWKMMLATVVVLTGGTWLACSLIATPVYRSQVSLIFKEPRNDNSTSVDSSERNLEVFVKAQQQILQSDLVVARTKVIAEDETLRSQWLNLRSELETAQRSGQNVTAIQQRIDGFLTRGAGKQEGTVSYKVHHLLEHDQEELRKFKKSIELETPGGERVALTESFVVKVDRPGPKSRAESFKDAHYAADILADMYMARHRQLQTALTAPAAKVMETVIDEIDKDVETKRKNYEAFVQKYPADIGVLEQLTKSGAEQGVQIVLTKIREEDARLQLRLAKAKALQEVIAKDMPEAASGPGGIESLSDDELTNVAMNLAPEVLADNPVVLAMRTKVAEAAAKRAKLSAQYTPEARNMRFLAEEVTQLKRQLAQTVVGYTRSLQVTIKTAEEQLAKNREIMSRTLEEQNETTRKLAEYIRKKNDLETAERQLADLKKERVNAEASSLRARDMVTIRKLDEASMPNPSKPASPKTMLWTAVAFIASVLLGTSMAFGRDHFDHSLRSTDEAERYLGIPVVGTVKRYGGGLVAGA